jgi:DNA-directed RNA polymerase specialized sigma24 family protein
MLDEYLIKNYDRLKDVALNIAGIKEYEELLHFVIEELYKCDQIRLREIIEKKQMTFYAVRVMMNQYHSKTSRYYYKYKKYYEYHATQTIESLSADKSKSNKKKKEEIEVKLDWIEEKLKDLYWFDAEVFKLYYRENFSLSEMAKATKINKNTLYKAIRNVKNYLINEKN